MKENNINGQNSVATSATEKTIKEQINNGESSGFGDDYEKWYNEVHKDDLREFNYAITEDFTTTIYAKDEARADEVFDALISVMRELFVDKYLEDYEHNYADYMGEDYPENIINASDICNVALDMLKTYQKYPKRYDYSDSLKTVLEKYCYKD